MGDYINREAARNELYEADAITMKGVAILNQFPSADVVEVRHGQWVDTEPNLPDWSHRKKGMAYYCSVCGHSAGKNKHNTYRWCPWCGAKMDGGKDE